MVKKVLIGVGVVLFVVSCLLAWILFQPKKSIVNFLPQEPMVYVEINHLSQNYEKFINSYFFTKVKDIKTDVLVQNGAITPEQKSTVDNVVKVMEDPSMKMFLSHFFSNQTAFVYYPMTLDAHVFADPTKMKEMLDKFLSSFLVVTRIDSEAKALDLILKMTGVKTEDVTLDKIDYNNNSIQTVKINKSSLMIYYFTKSDFLVLGLSIDAMKSSLDAASGTKPALSKDPQYLAAKVKWIEKSDVQGYLNWGSIMIQMKDLMSKSVETLEAKDAGLDEKESKKLKKQIAQTRQQLDQSFKGIEAFSWVSFSGTWDKLSKSKVSFPVDTTKLSADVAQAILCPSIENNSLKFIPKDVIAYVWVGCFKFDYYWNQIKKEVEAMSQQNQDDGLQADPIKSFEGTVGLSVEGDILPAFGDEFGGYLNDIKLSGLFPIPELAVFIRVEDKNKVEKILGKMMESPLIKVQKDEYNGTTINYFVLPMGDQIQPSFAYVGDYLLFAINRQMLTNVVDVLRNKADSLIASDSFKEINFGLTDKNTDIQYLRFNTLMTKIKGLVQWGDSWAQGQEASRQAFREETQNKIALLNASRMTSASELDDLKYNRDNIQSQIKTLTTQGLDIANQQAELKNIEDKIATKEKSIAEDAEQKTKLEEVLTDYADSDANPQLRRVMIQELLYPVMDGLTEYETLGIRTFIDKNSIETESYLKMK